MLRTRRGPDETEPTAKAKGTYRAWAHLLRRTFEGDVLECPTCQGRLKLLAIVTRPENITRYLTAIGEPTDLPARSPSRWPPYWKSVLLPRKALGNWRSAPDRRCRGLRPRC
ncbi:MAG: hypothetical protein WKG00_12210 [Polyangiaceae bacterium]